MYMLFFDMGRRITKPCFPNGKRGNSASLFRRRLGYFKRLAWAITRTSQESGWLLISGGFIVRFSKKYSLHTI